MGDKDRKPFQFSFNGFLKVDFQGSQVTSVDTASIEAQLVGGGSPDAALSQVLRLAAFPFVCMIALPTERPDVQEQLESYGVLCAEEHGEDALPLIREESSSIRSKRLLSETDLIVISDSGAGPKRLPRSFWQEKPGDALEICRLLFTSRGYFCVTPHFRVDDLLYSIYRRWRRFPGVQLPWSTATHCSKVGHFPNGLYEQLQSLLTRQDFLCRSLDHCLVQAMHDDTQERRTQRLYHFTYFVMLVTGLFDDLAWVACKLFDIRLEDEKISERQVGLRTECKQFRKVLSRRSASLRGLLNKEKTKNLIELFYPIRDQLQHRVFLKPLTVSTSARKLGVIELPRKTLAHMDNHSGRAGRPSWGVEEFAGEHYLVPERFVQTAICAISDLHDAFLRVLPWSEILDRLPVDEQRGVKEAEQRFKGGVAKYLNWPAEPVYF